MSDKLKPLTQQKETLKPSQKGKKETPGMKPDKKKHEFVPYIIKNDGKKMDIEIVSPSSEDSYSILDKKPTKKLNKKFFNKKDSSSPEKIQPLAKGGRAGYKSGSKGCKLAMKGKGRAYGKNS